MGLLFLFAVCGMLKLFLLAFVCVVIAQDTCNNFVDSNGCTYDLSSLTMPPTGNSFYTYSDTLGNFTVNVCGAVNSDVCGADAGSCQQQGTGNETLSFSCGKASTAMFGTYSGLATNATCPGVQITYSNGTDCALNPRSTILNIGCDPSNPSGDIISVSEDDTCEYSFQMWAAAACGTPPVASISPAMSPSMNTTSPVMSPTLNGTISCSMNCTSSTNSTATATVTTSTSGNSNTWIWWTLGAVGIVIFVLVIAGAGFFVYKKKRTTYDSLGDYDD